MILIRFISEAWSAMNFVARRIAAVKAPIRLGSQAKVVGIGNLQAGGAGKTPVVVAIAQNAVNSGKKVVILMRGYGGELESSGGYILGQKTPRAVDPVLVGDEAALIHEKVPEASIVVGRRRVRQFQRFVTETGVQPDLILIDDAFQQFRIAQDQKVLLVTSRTRSQVPYRDFFCEAKRADLVVHTKGEHFARGLPEPQVVLRFGIDLGGLREKAVASFCGIADPERFEEALGLAGYDVRLSKRFPDHHHYEEADLEEFCLKAQLKKLAIVTTEKDWVKIKNLEVTKQHSVIPIRQTIEVAKGRELWETLWQNTL